jgi:nucleoside-diphosphate-sugar epimerase
MAKVLILGGTRNLGHVTAIALLRAGHAVTVLNRGVTPDDLPPDVERIRGSRGDTEGLLAAVRGSTWDVVIDTTSFTGEEAAELLQVFDGKCGRIIFVSTGQVYLVRENVTPPFSESDFAGPVTKVPSAGTSDYDNWLYGINKRNAEEKLVRAARSDFPVVALRLPMIASERDHYGRIQAYLVRALDGGPLVIPGTGNLPIRHVYVGDVARLINQLCTDQRSGYSAYNISCTQSITLFDFFDLLRNHVPVRVIPIERRTLEAEQLIPACSPYSGRWMSELDSSLSVRALAAAYTAPAEYVSRIAEDYFDRWRKKGIPVPGYEKRASELRLAMAE